jgi:hypothetical protein
MISIKQAVFIKGLKKWVVCNDEASGSVPVGQRFSTQSVRLAIWRASAWVVPIVMFCRFV